MTAYKRAPLLLEMIRNRGNDDILLAEQIGMKQQARLVMQNMLPPMLGDELGDEDGDMIRLRCFPLHRLDELQNRPHDAAIAGAQRDEPDAGIPLLPLLLHARDGFVIESHIDSDDVVGERLGIAQRMVHDAGNAGQPVRRPCCP